MALEAWSLARPDPAAISSGRTPLDTYYTGSEITFHFPYELFSWLPLFPARWIETIVVIQAVAGIMMAVGLFYRVSAAAVFLTWGYLWVVESTRTYWQSHYYLETLLTFLMIWMPAARRYSADAWLARRKNPVAPRIQAPGPPEGRTPNVWSSAHNPSLVPFWALFLLRGQLLIAYFYAGVAKLNVDWLRDAMPVRWFIAQPHVTAPYARFLSPGQLDAFKRLLHTPEVAYFLSYSGLLFDLLIGFLLLARRTRIFGLLLMVIFHATNHLLIFDDIGWFPLVGILTALIFLDADWPERFWSWVRRPRIGAPDWRWFAGGGLAVPIVGTALGWKLRPSETRGAGLASPPLRRGVTAFVVAWLVWQTLMPIRHYFIEGDGRFTYEGLSLSWRLKSEVRRAFAAQLYLSDPKIISNGQVNWNEWKGDKVIYRTVTPGRIDWRAMPEILALVDPGAGEQVIYNPYPAKPGSDAEARARAGNIWSEMYGRMPKMIRAPATVEETLRTTGSGPDADAPFLIIDDAAVTGALGKGDVLPRISRAEWKASPYTRAPDRPNRNMGVEPLVIYLSSIGPELRGWVPRASIFDSQDQPALPPYLYWNSVGDLTVSKVMHMSYQAFYLRRYARRVADLWAAEYGRRPVVQAMTAVSLNGRPPQQLVDPTADLARVSARWFSHNVWIRQLETYRIPKESVGNPPVL